MKDKVIRIPYNKREDCPVCGTWSYVKSDGTFYRHQIDHDHALGLCGSMKVLIACEESGIVREAFNKAGHDAWSCDVLPTRIQGQHYQGDVRDILDDGWDLMIAFPPCTYLCSSGLHWNKRIEGRQAKTDDALDFIRLLLNADIPKIALENPIGCISTQIRKYDQKIQPWQFGHDASKGTCLWLKNLPLLKHTEIIPPAGWSLVKFAFDNRPCEDCGEPFCDIHDLHYGDCECLGPTQDDATYKRVEKYNFAIMNKDAGKPVWKNQTPSGQNKLGPSPTRARDRAVTYQGIADAMADQWS